MCVTHNKVTRYHGKTCATHPDLGGERLLSNSACVGCHYERARARLVDKRKNDPEQLKKEAASNRLRYAQNAGHRTKKKAKAVEWEAANKATGNAITNARRAARVRAMPAWVDRAAIKAIYAEAKSSGLTVDHYYPLKGSTVCGLHVPWNLVLVSQAENDRKGNKHPADFYGGD